MNLLSNLVSVAEKSLPASPTSPHPYLPTQSSTVAAETDWLFEFMTWMSILSCAAIFGAMVYFVLKYRAKARAANETASATVEHNTTLELTWSIAPLFIVMALFVWGFKGFVVLRTTPAESLQVNVTAQKWKWLFTYANGCESDKLHVPKDTNVRTVMSSVDVIHSLYVPAFRVKMDAVPGRFSELWFNAKESGKFPLFCTEYCGDSHSDMITEVVVHETAEFDTWLEKCVTFTGAPHELGAKLYEERGCSTCHSVDGSIKVGPSFKGLFGKNESFADGSTLKVDENYLRESILQPQAKIVKGFAPAMPTYQGQLSDKQIEGLIAYIQTLK